MKYFSDKFGLHPLVKTGQIGDEGSCLMFKQLEQKKDLSKVKDGLMEKSFLVLLRLKVFYL